MESPTVQRLLRRLRELREQRGLTQEGSSEVSGISYKYYQAVEAGRKRDLRLSTLERLAKAHGIEIWQLFAPGTSSAIAVNFSVKNKKAEVTGNRSVSKKNIRE